MIFVCFYHEKRADFCRICPFENLYAMLRRRATASGMTSIRNSASACVFVSSRLMRIVPFASSGDMPIAVSTWLGSSAPAEHAAPADDIKKVYSIWLCFGVPDYIGNAISEYRME